MSKTNRRSFFSIFAACLAIPACTQFERVRDFFRDHGLVKEEGLRGARPGDARGAPRRARFYVFTNRESLNGPVSPNTKLQCPICSNTILLTSDMQDFECPDCGAEWKISAETKRDYL